MIKKILMSILLVGVSLVVICLNILLLTSTGLETGLLVLGKLIPGTLSVETVHGRLANRFVLEGVRYSGDWGNISLGQVVFSWHPYSLLQKEFDIRSFLLRDVSMELISQSGSPESSTETDSPFVLSLPVAIKIAKGALENITVRLDGEEQEIPAASLRLENLSTERELLQIGRLELLSEIFQIAVHGHIKPVEGFPARLEVEYVVKNDAVQQIAGVGKFEGTLEELAYSLRLERPVKAHVQGVIFDVAGKSRWTGVVTSETVALHEMNRDWPELLFRGFQLTGEGTFETYALRAQSLVSYDRFQDISVAANIKGDTSGLKAVDIQANRESMELHAVGSVSWEEFPAWQGTLTGTSISPGIIDPAWPGKLDLAAAFSGSVKAEKLLNSVDLQRLDGELRGELLHAQGKFMLDGNNLQVDQFQILVDRQKMELYADGSLSWEEFPAWQGKLTGTNISPDLIDPSWPGKLDLAAAFAGSVKAEKLLNSVDLQRLDGELRGYPVHAQGSIMVDGNNIAVDQLHVQSADTILKVGGSIGDSLGLDFSFISPDLAAAWPELTGYLEGRGHVGGSSDNPEVRFDITGTAMGFGKATIGNLTAQGSGTLGPQGSFRAHITARELVVADKEIDEAIAVLDGSLEDHMVDAVVKGDNLTAQFLLNGGYVNEKWNGQVSKLSLRTDLAGEWQLQEPALIKYSSTTIDVGEICFAGMDDARICVTGSFTEPAWRAGATISSFPVSLLQNMQDNFDEIGGMLSGSITVQGKDTELVTGKIEFSTDNIFTRQTLSEGYSSTLKWKRIAMNAVLDGQILNFGFGGTLEDGSTFSAEAELNDLSVSPLNWENSTVNGTVSFNITDLSPIASLSYPVVEPSGTLRGKVDVRGKVTHPEFHGQVALEKGMLILPEQGVRVENLSALVESISDNRLQLKLSGTSGTGPVKAEGIVALDETSDERFTLLITGENVEVVNLPDMQIRISPDLRFKLVKDLASLQGEVLVTDALIAPQELKGVVSSSKDIVIVDETSEEASSLPFKADVNVVAGKSVRVRAFGLKGFIGGRLRIVSQPERPLVIEGNLNVREGTYSIYGRQLNIVRGQLSYQGGPPDNPGIEVRAENTASGVTTGIEVSGFLREPEVGFYSTPPMEQDEIIKRLLMNTSLVGSGDDKGFFGSVASDTPIDPLAATIQDVKDSLRVDDIKIESGKEKDDLSLVIGTWITPKLYVSYGKNLLKESGNFNTKYVLGHGFSLETESGSTENGIDLMYEIDRY